MRYEPSQLGDIDEIQIVDLRGKDAKRVSEYMRLPALVTVAVTGERATQISELWRALPAGEQMRCHIPPFGLRFILNRAPVLEVSICWECNNVYGYEGDQPIHFEFDASATSSKELLNTLETAWMQLYRRGEK